MKYSPFTIPYSERDQDDLIKRLTSSRLPFRGYSPGWECGADLNYMSDLLDYWISDFDWKSEVNRLNAVPQFTADIDGNTIHFVYVKSNTQNSEPLLLSHGWPSSFAELIGLIGPLTDPASYGGQATDAFDVIIPSLPGFVFSHWAPNGDGVRIDKLWRTLMTSILGYDNFFAHGSDVGARVTSALGRYQSDVVKAIHLGSVDLDWSDPLPPQDEMSNDENDYIKCVAKWEREEGAYANIQSTYPLTLAYGLNDSPVGLAAWIVDKFRAWSDCDGDVESRFSKDTLLTNIMLYWTTQCIGSSMRRYYDVAHDPTRDRLKLGSKIECPTGIAMFPGEKELVVPREFAERHYNVVRWSEFQSGGHFPALEEPKLLIGDIQGHFRPFRSVDSMGMDV